MAPPDNPLSKREQEILTLVARGLTNQEIARELVISPNTVKVHLRNIFEKLEAASRTEAIVRAAQAGWIQVAGLDEEEPAAAPPSPPAAVELPLRPWQRVYFVAAAALVLAALLLPGLWQRAWPAAAASDLSDASLPRLGAPARQTAGRWQSLAPMPTARSRLAVAALDGLLFAIAGETAEGVTAAVEVYDPQTNGWLPRAAKPTAVANAQAAAVGGRLYVPGGTLADGSPVAVLEVYDPAADAWSTASPMPQPLAGYALAAFQGRLYLFGGWNGAGYLDQTLVYDPAADTWRSAPGPGRAMGFAAAAVLSDRILLAGGFDGRRELAQCSLFYPAEARWAACAPLIAPRGGLGLAVEGPAVYAIGGGWTAALTFNERYDSLTDTWSSIPTPYPGQWRHLGVTALGSEVYAVGGWSGDYLDTVEVFLGPFRSFLPLGSRGQ
ncbi:MAG: LuxR C-terminal-related transcriptional regulator [Caldilineales bacterium]|nr:LuxR C-terminal-related transcriptional regulator [Caldilineales bacterium]